MPRINVNPHVLRAMDVERWHTHPAMGRQTVGHHTSRMLMIAFQLVDEPSTHLLYGIISHDAPEVYTGDYPSPVKWGMPESVARYFAEQDSVALGKLGMALNIVEEWEAWVIEYCDIMEALVYSMDQYSNGVQMAKGPIQNAGRRVEQLIQDYQPEWPKDIYERAVALAKECLPKTFKEL